MVGGDIDKKFAELVLKDMQRRNKLLPGRKGGKAA